MLSALIYEYPVDRLVTLAKFKARTDAARVLGDLLSAYLQEQSSAGLLDSFTILSIDLGNQISTFVVGIKGGGEHKDNRNGSL